MAQPSHSINVAQDTSPTCESDFGICPRDRTSGGDVAAESEMFFDRANALQEMIDFLGESGHAVNRRFERIKSLAAGVSKTLWDLRKWSRC